jgi:ABC-2 type transport system ATP-binding protein
MSEDQPNPVPQSLSSVPAVVSLRDVSKWYGDVIGVNQVSLDIGPGIMGLLGPNGAGKSTLLRLITGQLRPGSGTISVFGFTPFDQSEVFRRVGFCPDTEAIYEDMTGFEFVTLMARLSDFSKATAAKLASELLEYTGMSAHMKRRIKGYSKGMRQRTKLAAALLHDPELVILDEPLNGLDPVGRHEMIQLFRELGSLGKTVIVSSHILHEIESLTQQIALMHRGRILAEGKVEEIRALIEGQPLTLQVSTPDAREIGRKLAGTDGVFSLTFAESDMLVVRTTKPESIYENIQAGVVDREFKVTGLVALDDNLDAVFQYLVKE